MDSLGSLVSLGSSGFVWDGGHLDGGGSIVGRILLLQYGAAATAAVPRSPSPACSSAVRAFSGLPLLFFSI